MKIKDGTHQTPTYCSPNNGFPFLSSKDITSEKINWDNIKYIIPDLHKELYAKIAPQKDDILLAKNGTTGVAALVEDDRVFDVYVTLAVLRPNQQVILPNYLLRIVNSPICKSQFDAHLKGMGVPNLHLNEIQKVLIPVPPLSEQKRIVKFLDDEFSKIDTLKTNAETNLKNAKELFESELGKIFGNPIWERKNFSDLFKLKSGDYLNSKDISEGKYPVYGGNGIIAFHNKYNLNGDNVIIGRVGALCGNVRFISEPIWLTDNAFRIVFLTDEFDYLFVTYLLNFLNLRSYARQAAQPVISNSSLKDISIPLPPLSVQKEIVARLDKLSENIKRLETNYKQIIANCDELKKSILKKTFEGDSRSSRE